MRHFARTTLVWFLVAFIGDALVAPLIDIAGRAPDFTIIALVLLALSAGAVPATAGGFVIGLVQDLGNPRCWGCVRCASACSASAWAGCAGAWCTAWSWSMR